MGYSRYQPEDRGSETFALFFQRVTLDPETSRGATHSDITGPKWVGSLRPKTAVFPLPSVEDEEMVGLT